MLIAATSTADAVAGDLPATSPRSGLSAKARVVRALGGEAQRSRSARYSYLDKLDSHVLEVAAARLEGDPVSDAAASEGITVSPGGAVSVDVYVRGDRAAEERRRREAARRARKERDRQ
ncbi:MAG TPA: hypothetical protein PKD63_09750, partial [Solirubrobacteraceae bacterium]|nr:hypothetical protein [Solirubrobacteraceae bacterium]